MVRANFVARVVLCVFSASFILFPKISFADTQKKWKVRSAYHFERISFASDAHGANFLFAYDEAKQWGFNARFNYIDKFNDSAPGFGLGGTYWPTQTTTLSLDGDFGPGQAVIPRQAYTFTISQALFKVLVPALGYRFADYQTANAHTLMPEIAWYFYPRFDWMARYFMTISQLAGRTTTSHSVMTKLNWNPWDPFNIFAGYARANESFESGNPISPTGAFSANHVFGGFKWEFYKGLGAEMSLDYERRNNGFTIETLESAVFYRW